MVSLISLWLPIVLSAVAVFLASWIVHMLLRYHRSDYKPLPDEEGVVGAMRAAKLTRGVYGFPHCDDPKDHSSPEMKEKFEKGPFVVLTVMPPGVPRMWKYLVGWLLYCLVLTFCVAYVASRTLVAGTDYLAVFRVVGAVAFLGYFGAEPIASIWKGQPWLTTLKNGLDGLIYALLTAGFFGWLWP
jgi:hypothetical protein